MEQSRRLFAIMDALRRSRKAVPASALAGASLMLLADLAARLVLAPAELPIGIVTALIGAPFFLYLLVRGRP